MRTAPHKAGARGSSFESLLALVGLATGFVVPAFAQEKYTQLTAALALAQAALSTTGYTLFSEIRAADDVLASVNSLIWDSGSLYAVEDRRRVLRRRGGDRLDV